MVRNNSNVLTLRVADALESDVGRGLVRISYKIMREYNLETGDIVEIIGPRGGRCGALVITGRNIDKDKNIIRMDGFLRQNAGVSVGEMVTVRKIERVPAKEVVLAPAKDQFRLVIRPNILKDKLLNRPVKKGDLVSVAGNLRGREFAGSPFGMEQFFQRFLSGDERPIALRRLLLVVTDTKPDGIVVINEHTKIRILEQAPKAFIKENTITYDDIGGLKNQLERVRELIELPLKHPELFERLGIDPPKGVLLYGPPGSGKTLMARAVANEAGVNFISIAGPEVMSKFYGESEARLRQVFLQAEQNAPSIIFIDELDSIAPKRDEVTGEVERRVVAQILSLMDGLKSRGKVIVIGATNRPNAVDPALRRPGRFDREIEIPVPDENGRYEILRIHTRGMPLDKDVDLKELAKRTHGFVGADLAALTREAAMHTLRRILSKIPNLDKDLPPEIYDELIVTKKDFEEALKTIEPSAMREVLIEIPNVRWSDIGGLESVKQKLREAVELPISRPEIFEKHGIEPPRGILLYGPPGTGKTLLAKAVATETEANFIAIKGPELLSKWVGESERALRDIFRKAKQAAPSIIFFDEIDSIAPRRGLYYGDSGVTESLLNQLLTLMSGIEQQKNVVVIGATNRPDILDPAILRPGRFDRLIRVPVPDRKARLEILKIHTKKMRLAKDVSLDVLADQLEGYVGADIENLCREAVMIALRENIDTDEISMQHFMQALEEIHPSVPPEVERFYEEIERKMIGKESLLAAEMMTKNLYR